MSLLRKIGADLVDKRLWPVALALVVALVAVPVGLTDSGGSGAGAGAAPVAPPAPPVPLGTSPAIAPASVTLAVGANPPKHDLRGSRARDPFKQLHVPSLGSTKAPATSGTSSGGGTPSAGKSAPSFGTTPPSTKSKSSTPPSKHDGSAPKTPTGPGRGSLEVRFGQVDGTAEPKVVKPLEALPDRDTPLVIYLGPEHGRAAFLVSSSAVPSGQIACKPSKDKCAKALVRPGEKMLLDVVSVHGTTQYLVDVVDLAKRRSQSG